MPMLGIMASQISGHLAPPNITPTTWSSITYPFIKSPSLVAATNSIFVVISENGTNTSAGSSTNGTTWTSRTMPGAAADWQSVAVGGSTFSAVASSSPYGAYSTNGTSWTSATMPYSVYWAANAYGNGTFVAVSYSTAQFAKSTDGITWTGGSLPAADAVEISYGGGLWLVTTGTSAYFTSPDLTTWTSRTLPSSNLYFANGYGNGVFVVIKWASSQAYTSTDGINWTSRTMPVSGNWIKCDYYSGSFVAMINGSTVYSSPDGVTWTSRTMPASHSWTGLAFGNQRWIAGQKDTASSDGATSTG